MKLNADYVSPEIKDQVEEALLGESDKKGTQKYKYGLLGRLQDWPLFIALSSAIIGVDAALTIHKKMMAVMPDGGHVVVDALDNRRVLQIKSDESPDTVLRYLVSMATTMPIVDFYATISDWSGGRIVSGNNFKMNVIKADVAKLRRYCRNASMCFGNSKERKEYEKKNPFDAILWCIKCIEDDMSFDEGGDLRWDRMERVKENIHRIQTRFLQIRRMKIVENLSRSDVRGWLRDKLQDAYPGYRDVSFNRDLESKEIAAIVRVFGLHATSDLTGIDEIRINEAIAESELNFSVEGMLEDTLTRFGVTDITKVSNRDRVKIMREMTTIRALELIADQSNSARDLAPILKTMMDRDHQEREVALEKREADVEQAVGFLQTLAEYLDGWIQGLFRQIEADTGKQISITADPVSLLRQWMSEDPALMDMLGVSRLERENRKAIDITP